MEVLYIIAGTIVFLALVLIVTCRFCFDDTDPDMYWHDNYAAPPVKTKEIEPLKFKVDSKACTHPEKTLFVVNVSCTCEEVYTICDVCGEVIHKETNC
jgi:hypothetical protein